MWAWATGEGLVGLTVVLTGVGWVVIVSNLNLTLPDTRYLSEKISNCYFGTRACPEICSGRLSGMWGYSEDSTAVNGPN